MKCHFCDSPKERVDMIGANIFDASTGAHIITRWCCMPCAIEKGLIK